MDGITVITSRRSGAGHLFALLRNFEAVAPSDGLFADGAGGAGARIDQIERDAQAEGKRLLVLKATPLLPRETIEAALLGRPGMRAAFVLRRQIDTYVSLVKATALDAWRDTDLTPVKVKLDAGHFAAWLDEQDSWHAQWRNWLARRALPAPVLRYETHLTLPPEAVLRRFAATAAQLGISLSVPARLPFPGLTQQDRGKAVALKVKNWPEFSRALIERGIEKRAFGYPM